jgi:large subunit ribosomal protein L27
MATTKSAGTVKTGRDSKPKYLGVKIFGGQKAKVGDIIIRQRGSKFIPGKNVKKGRDDTLYALKEGIVTYLTKRKNGYDGAQRRAKIVTVIPSSSKKQSS